MSTFSPLFLISPSPTHDAISLPDEPTPGDVFEGPEKKLEVFFTMPPEAAAGFRQFETAVWSDVLADAHCSILHTTGNAAFDAYLLSESSLFVYPHKLILKTCGTTTLLLVLPKLLVLARQVGCDLSHVHYSHFRYAFPTLQPYPHTSFDEERATLAKLLHGHIGPVTAKALGGSEHVGSNRSGGARWYALCAEALNRTALAKNATAPPATEALAEAAGEDETETDIIELAMESLSPAVRNVFICSSHAGAEPALTGRALARTMSEISGIAALVPGAILDDWAFEPCGYSMNALNGSYYYTVHVTPETDYSYASFETNDPAYANSGAVASILSVFQPATATVTVTSRVASGSAATPSPPQGLYSTVSEWSTSRLSPLVAVSVASYALGGSMATAALAAPKRVSPEILDDAAISWADSESTAPLEDVTELCPETEEGVYDEKHGLKRSRSIGDAADNAVNLAPESPLKSD